MRWSRRLCALGLALSLGASVSTAGAQDMAAAEALFREGKALLQRGDLDAACTKLAASQQLDPSSGTLLNLAMCHERQGKGATAWAEFLAAGRLAQTQGKPERVVEAKRRAAALEPTLSYLVVTVSKAVPGLTIKYDGTELDAGAWGSRIPVDAGAHELVASAPGYDTAKVALTVGKSPEVKNLTIPELHEAAAPPAPTGAPSTAPPVPAGASSASPAASTPPVPAAAPPAPASPEAPPDRGAPSAPDHTAAYVVGGIGGAALLVGGTFGLLAMSAYSNAKDACPAKTDCNDAAMSEHDSAVTRARIADIGVGVGVVGLAVGSVLYFTAGGGEGNTTNAKLAPYAGPSQAGLSFAGAF